MIQIIKKAAVEAVENSNPVKICYGTVLDDSASIRIEQKFTITKEFLVLTMRMKEEGLSAGDKVILLQEQGGQRFIVLDKVGG